MTETSDKAAVLNPDLAFVREVKRIGGDAMKYCYQCGTCTSICPVAPDDNPFPRKEMLWAQWGLKERLLNDPDVWLCHGCGDCTAYCPRGADPSEVMAALRGWSILHHSVPRFLGRWLASPAYIPLLVAVPVLIMAIGFLLAGGLVIPAGEVQYYKLIPFIFIELIGNGVMLLALIGAGVGLSSFWRGMSAHQEAMGYAASPPGESMIRSVLAVVGGILAHRRFRQCGSARARAWQHAGLFYGFLLLFAASAGRLFYYYVLGSHAEVSLADPVKIVGNLGGIAMTLGLAGIIAGRLARRPGVARSSYFDWFLIWALALSVLTGFASQFVRFNVGGAAAYYTYLIHLVFVFVALIYLPYSKFAHLLYRFTAMLHARRTGREVSADAARTGLSLPAVEDAERISMP